MTDGMLNHDRDGIMDSRLTAHADLLPPVLSCRAIKVLSFSCQTAREKEEKKKKKKRGQIVKKSRPGDT